MDIDKFIQNLNKIKEERDLNDKQLGDLFGVSDVVVSNYRRRLTIPKRYNLDKFCQALGLNYEWLVGNVDNPIYDVHFDVVAEQQAPYNLNSSRQEMFLKITSDAYALIFEEMVELKTRINYLERQLLSKS